MSVICQQVAASLLNRFQTSVFCPHCGQQLHQTAEPKIFVSMPAGDYVTLYGAGKTADFFSRFGWLKAFGLIIGPIFGVALLYTSEDQVGHSVVTPERMKLAALCFSGVALFVVWKILSALFAFKRK